MQQNHTGSISPFAGKLRFGFHSFSNDLRIDIVINNIAARSDNIGAGSITSVMINRIQIIDFFMFCFKVKFLWIGQGSNLHGNCERLYVSYNFFSVYHFRHLSVCPSFRAAIFISKNFAEFDHRLIVAAFANHVFAVFAFESQSVFNQDIFAAMGAFDRSPELYTAPLLKAF